jgi:hypothetical protein
MKLIIDIPVEKYNEYKRIGDSRDVLFEAIRNGTPLDSDSERAEVQAYFAGMSYGWEEGRKDLIDDVKAEIRAKHFHIVEKNDFDNGRTYGYEECLGILNNIGKEGEE